MMHRLILETLLLKKKFQKQLKNKNANKIIDIAGENVNFNKQ